MNRKLIAIDLDGTLLRPDYSIGPLTLSVLRTLAQEGHMIMLSSGRPARTLLRFAEELGCAGPLSAYNGAYVFHASGPACFPTFDPSYSSKDIQEIFLPIQDKLLFFMGEDGNRMIQNKRFDFLADYFPLESIHTEFTHDLYALPKNLKIFVFATDDETASGVHRLVKEQYPHLHYHRWKKAPLCELVLDSITKGTALKKVAEYYGFEKDDIIAFGDSGNDIPMLSLAGKPFAMKGCKSSKLASLFPATEKGNAEEGVAFELTKLF